MSMRKSIEEMIIGEAKERGIGLSANELSNAVAGVEYWVMEGIGDSIDTALSNVTYDRGFRVEVLFYLAGDESGRLHDTEFTSAEEYAEWLEDMNKSIEIFSEKFI